MDITLRDGTVLTGKAARAYQQALDDARIRFQNSSVLDDPHPSYSINRPTLKNLQEEAHSWANEYWPDRPAEIHMIKLMEEAGELAETFTKVERHLSSGRKLDQAGELADVVIVAMVLAGKLGIELDEEITKKLDHNRRIKTAASLQRGLFEQQADFNFDKARCNQCDGFEQTLDEMERHHNRHMRDEDC